MRIYISCRGLVFVIFLIFFMIAGFSYAAGNKDYKAEKRVSDDGFTAQKITNRIRIPSPSALKAGTKRACLFQQDNGLVLSYFPNFRVGDMNAIYFDPQNCGVPYPYPFQINDVEFLLFNHAGIDSTKVRFSVWTVVTDSCQSPQTQIYTSPIYDITTFYPNWTSISFSNPVCVNDRFFFVLEYADGDYGSIPSLVSDTQQEMVDTCYQWLWHDPYSPPWREWNNFWNDPDPGWLMLRLGGETYSLACDTGWLWLADNGSASSGAPDVSENQNGWMERCGAVAMGNCLEWFGLYSSLGWNIPEFVDTLADYFQTDSAGTEVHRMKAGIDDFLNDFMVSGIYSSIWSAPEFPEMSDSLKVNQNITLLLGFWWWDGNNWWREGGHYITVSGMNPQTHEMALSDPARDQAEYGWPGRVRPLDHPSAPHADTLHNDLLYVSHDIYQCQLESSTPGNPHWELTDYLEPDPDTPRQFTGKNFPVEFLPYFQSAPPETGFVTAVEYAVMICSRQEDWWWEASYPDYAPSGMPDFDQKQDNWINPITFQPTFSAPAAVANSFWWLDSKFDVPAGSMGDGTDQYPLVRDYLDNLSPYLNWDDHDLANVDHSSTSWYNPGPPPSTPQPFISGPQSPGGVNSWGELIERLAWFMDTDGRRSGDAHIGTKVQTIVDALPEWFSSEAFTDGSSLNDSLGVKMWGKPTFTFVDSLVEIYGNVILLLGFWYQENSIWWRVGGHYVTVAGVNPVQQSIAFSDPFFDRAENGAPGLVLSGSYLPHDPIPHRDSTLHNDPGNAAHDIYNASLNNSNPAGEWWVLDYPVDSNPDSLTNVFYQQNIPDEFISSTRSYVSGYPVCTVVEYAVLIDLLHFDRGDVNGNGTVEIGDIVFLINYLFKGQSPPAPLSSGDVNCDDQITIGDVVFIMNFLFRQGPPSGCCGP